MSFRREPRTVDEKIAALEEQLRRTQRGVLVQGQGLSPTIFLERGDLLVATGPGEATVLPPGPAGSVLTADPAATLGVTWAPGSDMLSYLMDDA